MLEQVGRELVERGFKIVGADLVKPWGGYFCIDDKQLDKFIGTYFPGVAELEDLTPDIHYSPKVLVVEAGKKLSWQVHQRRYEMWRVIQGPVGVYMSSTDSQPEAHQQYEEGEFIIIDRQIRHRLVGLEDWGVVAEIWVHTDKDQPSDEEDIVRIADDFGR